MSEELKSWTSDRSGNPIDIGGRVPIRSGTTLHGFDAPGASVPDEVRINGEVFVRKSTSQARLPEAVKVLEEVTKAFGEFTSQAPTMLSCGRHCTAEVEHMEEEAYASAHNHAAFQLRQAKAFLATIGEENEA